MQDLTLHIPGDSLVGVRIPPKGLETELLRRLAAALYSDGILSNASACRMAGLDKAEFQHFLGERGITQPLDTSDLEDDIANMNAWKDR